VILTLTPNPCVDKTLFIPSVELGSKHVAEKYGCVPGGKGSNVSRAVKSLGFDTAAMVVVGGAPGKHVVQMIEEDDGVICHPVWVAGMTRTITTILETAIHRQTPLFEPGPSVTESEKQLLIAQFQDHVSHASVVTFNGTVPDSSLGDLYAVLIPIAKECGAVTILDSHGTEFALGINAKPYMVKPNKHEAGEWAGFELTTVKDCLNAIDRYHNFGIPLVVMSLGPEGALVSQNGVCLQACPPKIKEINAVGSGDALVAGFAIGLHLGDDIETMTRRGIAAGTANAMCWDIGHFAPDEVEKIASQVKITYL